VSGDPIVVGSICSCSGAQSAVIGKVSEANKAWAASVNAAGGINGHPVKIITKDDAGDPAKGIAAAKELVQEHVQAIVGAVSLTDSVWAKIVDEAGIPVVDRVINGCAQQNYKPQQVVSITTVGNDSLKNPNFDGTQVAASNAFFTDDDVPGVKAFHDAIKAEAPEVLGTPLYNSQMEWAFTGGKLFEAAAAKAKLTPDSTPADVKKGLYALKDETLDGMSGPLTFTPGKPAFPSCYFQGEISGGAFKVASSKPTCLDQNQLGAVGQALAG
jgi:branched-chain amino acid transport system substrate-binding protein